MAAISASAACGGPCTLQQRHSRHGTAPLAPSSQLLPSRLFLPRPPAQASLSAGTWRAPQQQQQLQHHRVVTSQPQAEGLRRILPFAPRSRSPVVTAHASYFPRPWSDSQQQQQQQKQQQVSAPQPQPEAQSPTGGLQTEQLMTLETNIDDQAPQLVAYTSQKLLDTGALDVWTTPAVMKKGRPGMVLHVLCSPELVNSMLAVIFYETTSLGVRVLPCERVSVQRVVESVRTQWGFVPVKAAFIQGQLVTATAEYEECAKLARQHNAPLKFIKQAAERAYWESEARERESIQP